MDNVLGRGPAVPGLIPCSDKIFNRFQSLVSNEKEIHPKSYLLYGACGCNQKVSQ